MSRTAERGEERGEILAARQETKATHAPVAARGAPADSVGNGHPNGARRRGRNGHGAATGAMRCLIVGAGQGGRSIARDLRKTPEFGLRPIGFLDDLLAGSKIASLPVFGTTDDLVAVALEHEADAVILAITALSAVEVRRLAAAAASIGLTVRYLPSFLALLERDARITDLRALRVDRLLGRGEVHVVRSDSRSLVAGKTALVTGAGGSIGSELCRQIRGFGPRNLYLLDHDESNLHRLSMELDGRALLNSTEILIADIRDKDRIRQIFRNVRPELVFHAAAHKHLPLLELHPSEGVKTNVLGTLNLVEAAIETEVEKFILISTDKAADPTSILGATKRLAEIIVQNKATPQTSLASVRFGNVLGSRGSFLSVIQEQLESGGPVTVTHPEVTRYFMTIEEAVGLVIEAAGLAEQGETFVLNVGEPVRIVDLVHNYAAQLHMAKDDITIEYTGLRPGEKLTETLFATVEERMLTKHPGIWATRSPVAPEGFWTGLDALFAAAATDERDEVRDRLCDLLPEFRPAKSYQEMATSLASPYPDGF